MEIVDCCTDLSLITRNGIEGVIWRRSIPKFVYDSITSLSIIPMTEYRVESKPGDVGQHIIEFLEASGNKSSLALEWLAEDVNGLATEFASILSVENIRLRVEVVNDDACRKFHRDAVKARLICTYRGPGTEYKINDPNNGPEQTDTVPTGCPILLKGKSWPSHPSTGYPRQNDPWQLDRRATLLHRSPAIENKGTVRLIIVIDAAI